MCSHWIGACGQLGTGLIRALLKKGGKNVIGTDIVRPSFHGMKTLEFKHLNVLDRNAVERTIVEGNVREVYHYSAMLSYVAERNPERALQVNVDGFNNILYCAEKYNLKLFVPSTIGVFGKDTPKDDVPDISLMRPHTIYGISKVYNELLGQKFYDTFGVDFRCLRYPGILTADTEPGGGTTDYAVEVFHSLLDVGHLKGAIRHSRYNCPLQPDTILPMMYIDDCIEATVSIMNTPHLPDQRVYNVSGLSFSPAELGESIQRILPTICFSQGTEEFQIEFEMTFGDKDMRRQQIARDWPRSLDASRASRDWNFVPSISSLDNLTRVMITKVALFKNIHTVVK